MPDATWIEPRSGTKAFDEITERTVQFHMASYHRKITYAAYIRRKLANPYSRKYNLRVDKMWYARQVSKCWTDSAAGDLAAAKAALRGKRIYGGMFEAKAHDSGDGWDIDG
jgi:hypothetical protein